MSRDLLLSYFDRVIASDKPDLNNVFEEVIEVVGSDRWTDYENVESYL